MTWENRIVGEGDEDPTQLLANPLNWRVHPQVQQDVMAGVLYQVGWVQRVIVNQRTGHVIDGHLRVSLAIAREEKTVPVLYVDLSAEEERLVLSVLDPIATMATTDRETLTSLLEQVQADDDSLAAMLERMRADEGLLPPPDPEDTEQVHECPSCGASI